MSISRLYTFTPSNTILSAEVNAELNQLVTEVNTMFKKSGADSMTGDLTILKNTPSIFLSGSETSGKNFKIKEDAGVVSLQFDNSGYQTMYSLDNTNSRHTFQTPGGTSLLKLETSAPTVHSAVANAFIDTYTRPTAGGGTEGKRGVAVSSLSSGSFSTSSTSYVDVTNLSVTLTTSGRPVFLMLINDGVSGAAFATSISLNTTVFGSWRFTRWGTPVTSDMFLLLGVDTSATENSIQVQSPPGVISHIDIVGAGTYTYKLQSKVNNASGNSSTSNMKLVAFEL